MSMLLISVNVAQPSTTLHRGESVLTGIFKRPVAGAVMVRKLNLDGDAQADLVHHGGESKAVYAYASEHYAFWEKALDRPTMAWGQFGENLTVAGLDEAELCIGDQLAVGEALLVISQPRVPCFKLGLRLDDARMPQLFAKSLRTGVYLRVLREGSIVAGNEVRVTSPSPHRLSVKRLFDAYLRPQDGDAKRLLRKALDIPELSPEWRAHITDRLTRLAHPAPRDQPAATSD